MTAPTTNAEGASSPHQSDRSSDSEGKPVREKLKETSIGGKSQPKDTRQMNEPMAGVTTNGTGDHTGSESESERGRLRRKRSHEDFEKDDEETKNPEKKQERHVRKKSRDITGPSTSDVEISKPIQSDISVVSEDGAGKSTAAKPQLQDNAASDPRRTPETEDTIESVKSPKNKRTREQAEESTEAAAAPKDEHITSDIAASENEQERTTKRQRDDADSQVAKAAAEGTSKVPPGSGFANTGPSGFAALASPKKPGLAAPSGAVDPPQTSDSVFKTSGLSAFANQSGSPFGGLKSGSSSPFGAAGAGAGKLASFASSSSLTAPATSTFGSSTNAPPSAFGGSKGSSSVFGGTLSSVGGFGGVSGTAKSTGFGSGAAITGLSKSPMKPFGSRQTTKKSASEDRDTSEDEDGADSEGGSNTRSERASSRPLLSTQATPETGEENEDSIWQGRAKLYTLAGETGKKSWQERGVGPFKLNVTRDDGATEPRPRKARLILRADGTHRLLLNVAVTREFAIGDATGGRPGDGKMVFTAPKEGGLLESHTLKLKAERAAELWDKIDDFKTSI